MELQEVKDHYTPLLGDQPFCNGLDVKIQPFERMSTLALQRWMRYRIDPYHNHLRSQNWDQDIVCVLLGRKKVALVDNDHLYAFISELDTELRYAVTHYCGMKALTSNWDNDTFTLYYYPEHWQEAALIYLHLEDRLDPPPTNPSIYDSILLGYTFESIVDFELASRRPLTPGKIHKGLLNSERYRQTLPLGLDVNNEYSDELRDFLFTYSYSREEIEPFYRSYYTKYIHVLPVVRRDYEISLREIEEGKREIVSGDRYKGMFYGLE